MLSNTIHGSYGADGLSADGKGIEQPARLLTLRVCSDNEGDDRQIDDTEVRRAVDLVWASKNEMLATWPVSMRHTFKLLSTTPPLSLGIMEQELAVSGSHVRVSTSRSNTMSKIELTPNSGERLLNPS